MAKQEEKPTVSVIVIPATKQQKELFELPFQMSEEERALNPPERAEITAEQKASIPDVISGYSLTEEDKRHLLLDALIVSEDLHYSIDDKNQIVKSIKDGEKWVELPIDQKNVSFLELSPKAEKSGKKALFEKVAEDLIKRLEEGTAPWQKPWGESGIPLLPYNPTTGKNYKGLNTFALMLAGRQDPRWLTFNQAVANKWSVKRGEKGSLINFFKFDRQEAIRDEKGKPVLDEQGKQKYKTVKLDKPIITSAYVFNAEQVEGIPKLEITVPENNWKAIESVEQVLKNSGAVIKNVPGDDAFYSPIQDYIQMPLKEQFPDAGLYYATALHELGHWTGHEDRLNRPILNQFGTEAYAKEELRAEIGSYMLGTDLQIGHDPSRHAAYVANWITVLKNDPFEIHRAAADAQKIYDMVKGFEQKIVLDKTIEPELKKEPALKGKVRLGLNEVINHNNQNYEVMALLRKGAFQMRIQETGRVFTLKSTDGLYNSLINHKEATLLAANISKGEIKTLPDTEKNERVSADLETAELYSPEISKGFKR